MLTNMWYVVIELHQTGRADGHRFGGGRVLVLVVFVLALKGMKKGPD